MSPPIRLCETETPKDITQIALQLCKDYIGGAWNGITENQLILRRISGGFSNQLYYCGIPHDVQCIGTEPKEVALKLYLQKHYNCDGSFERFTDLVSVLCASLFNLGPKVYGISVNAEIVQYIESHEFRIADQSNARHVQQLAQKLAQFHALIVPLPKTTFWLEKFFDDYWTKAQHMCDIRELSKITKTDILLSIDINAEIQWLKKCIGASNSPIVFSHNDFRPPNILVRDSVTENHNLIMFCDFEYSCYYHRGWDFGTLFTQWGRSEFEIEVPFPDDQLIEQFICHYHNECAKIYGNDYLNKKENSIKHLLNEIKFFTLCEHMFIALFILCMKKIPKGMDKTNVLIGAEKRIIQYLVLKDVFKSQNAIPLLTN